MNKPIIEFQNFSFQYNSQSEPTLKDLNLKINEGEKVLVVGPSGSGKSTFAHCINGLIPYEYQGEITGTAKIKGKDLQETSIFDLSFDTGTVLQDTDGQFIGLTVAEDLAFTLENDAVEQTQMKKKVAQWARTVGINDHLAKRPQDLSGGQKQRVSMAGVLINESPILLFDEPLANLDPATGKEAIGLIDDIHQRSQSTVIIIEHRLEDALAKPVDRIIVFNDGEVIADQSPDELLKTDLLAASGIREPLYLTALKYAGVDFSNLTQVAELSDIRGNDIKQKVVAWQAELPEKVSDNFQTPLFSMEQVSYKYHKQDPYILNGLSLTLHQGEKISVVGKNGAGKSTLFKAICGFIQPTGQMKWLEQSFDQESIKERADKIGYVMQNPNQMISQKMIFDEVALGLVLREEEPERIKEKVFHALKVCGLYPFRNWPIAALSYGQKKRVTIAAILVLEPEMLVLDEPTAGQDFRHYSEMMTFIEELNQLGKTIVMITHDMHLMLEYSDRALVISDGEILADTDPIDVLTNDKLIEQASLKETSLFTLAKQLELTNPADFIRKFIQYDREVRRTCTSNKY